jgi:outer membrane PBP1 activator LpoA protein
MISLSRLSLSLVAFALSLTLLLSGCSTTPKWQPPAGSTPATAEAEFFLEQGNYAAAAQAFLTLAEQAQSPLHEHYLTRAAEAFIHSGDIISAIDTADSINPSALSSFSQHQLTLLYSQIDISMGKPEQAIERLDQISLDELDPGFLVNYHTTRTDGYSMMGNLLESARERVLLNSILNDRTAIENNNAAIFEGLSLLSLRSLESLQPPAPDTLGGWMAIARILKNTELGEDQLELAIEEWQQQFPNHPADVDTLIQNRQAPLAISEMPHSIALFLPQSGNFAKAALAIQKGIVSAYYQNKEGPPPSIRLYDTESDDVATLYQAAIDDGAQLVIGPLNKKRVLALAQKKSLPIPVLALNWHRQESTKQPNLYQLSLSPEDEVEQSAASAWINGHRRALILAPSSSFGRRLARHFANYWQALGGDILEAQSYSPKQSDFSAPIKRLLNLDSSNLRYKRVRRLINRDIKFEPRRRQDADFLFLAASTRNARLIRPQLKFFRASRLPVYATSHLYSGQDNPSQDIDLNGITFTDIPWREAQKELKLRSLSSLNQAWKNMPPSKQRLFALGADAYNIIPQLARLQQSSSARFNGMTGKLYLDEQNQIHRQLNLFLFKKGLAKTVGVAPHLRPSAPPEPQIESGIILDAVE